MIASKILLGLQLNWWVWKEGRGEVKPFMRSPCATCHWPASCCYAYMKHRTRWDPESGSARKCLDWSKYFLWVYFKSVWLFNLKVAIIWLFQGSLQKTWTGRKRGRWEGVTKNVLVEQGNARFARCLSVSPGIYQSLHEGTSSCNGLQQIAVVILLLSFLSVLTSLELDSA